MFNIEFYEDQNGVSELWTFLDELQKKATTEFSTSLSKMTPTFSCTISAKRRRKRLHAKLKEPKRNAMTGFPERGNNYGNME